MYLAGLGGYGKLCLKRLFITVSKEKACVCDTPTVLWAVRIPFSPVMVLCMQLENIHNVLSNYNSFMFRKLIC